MATVSAEPTKEFFISMLTRDISLLSALVDLVDNSVDAAMQNDGVVGKKVEITLDRQFFEIKDSCGGIPKDAAENYAFKFGRPTDAPQTPHSVGRFGVGMKRAIFKLGRSFQIESRHEDSSFNINVNVNDWLASLSDWNFELEEVDDVAEQYGTSIRVDDLYQSIGEKLEDRVFINNLKSMIGKAHHKALLDGLSIQVNEEVVESRVVEIKHSEDLTYITDELSIDGVTISIKAGVGERDRHKGGWYVYCNDRMIEEASQSVMTGWGVDGIRNYHTDFAFFRGVIEFNCDDGAKLPWNTTKTGIDTDNPIYRTALVRMKIAMRKILSLLTERIKEETAVNEGKIEESYINKAINEASLKSAFTLPLQTDFVRPNFQQLPKTTNERRISYSVKESDLNRVKESLGVTTNKEAGLYTFDYYLENEL